VAKEKLKSRLLNLVGQMDLAMTRLEAEERAVRRAETFREESIVILRSIQEEIREATKELLAIELREGGAGSPASP
jgi:hypothetical protein